MMQATQDTLADINVQALLVHGLIDGVGDWAAQEGAGQGRWLPDRGGRARMS